LRSRSGDSSARAAQLESESSAAIERVQTQVRAGKKVVTDMLAAKVTRA
jgi:hypothetical protein